MNGSEMTTSGRVAAAARAAWWTLLVGAAILVVQGFFYQEMLRVERLQGFLADLWGVHGMDVRYIWLFFIAAYKLILLVWFLGCLFLSLWSRRLRRAGSA